MTSRSATVAARSLVDGVLRLQNLDGQFGYANQVALQLTAGHPVDLQLDYSPRQAAVGIIPPQMLALEVTPTIKIGPYVHLGMTGPGTATAGTVAAPDALIADAVTAAKKSKVAVVFVGESNGEGVDRSTLAAPGRAGRARRGRRPRESEHDRRPQHERPGADAVAARREGRGRDVVPRRSVRARRGGAPVR